MTTNMVKLSGHKSKYISILYSQLYNYLLLYIQLFKENATFKLHLVLIVLPCKNITLYIFNKTHTPTHNVCYRHFVKDGFHTAVRRIWIVDVFML